MSRVMDLLSCWPVTPASKRNSQSHLNDDRSSSSSSSSSHKCSVAPSQSHLRLVRSSSLSFDESFDSETLLNITEPLGRLEESDRHFKAVYQFLCSEKAYLDGMVSALDIYAEPLRKFSSMTSADIQTLFSDLDRLVLSSRVLCTELRSVIDRWNSESSQIGHLFDDKFWSLYDSYYAQHVHISRLLVSKQSADSEFAEFCRLREAQGQPSLELLLMLPMKRLASYADDLKDMASSLDRSHPDVPLLTQAADEANRLAKQRRSGDSNENYMTKSPDHVQTADISPAEKDVVVSAASRWKTTVSKTRGNKKQSAHPLSSLHMSSSMPVLDGSSQHVERPVILESPVKHTLGVITKDRLLVLHADRLLIAKGRRDANFRVKKNILTCRLWMAPCTEKTLLIGWPMQNATFTFETVFLKNLWQKTLKDIIDAEKAKESPNSVQIKIMMKDCDYTAVKSLVVRNNETASFVVERCVNEFHIVDGSPADFQLCVTAVNNEMCHNAVPLSGHEYPFTIWTSHAQHLPTSFESVMSTDTKIHFILRNNKKNQKFVVGEQGKSKGKALKRLFAKSVSVSMPAKPDQAKMFGRDLGDLFEQNVALPPTLMQMLQKLYSDGPRADGVFRRSAHHARLQTVKQSLDNGESVNFDEVPVYLTASILKDFLRSLPNCLLTWQLYSDWLKTVSIPDTEERIVIVKELVEKLPPCNQQLLRHLMCVLHKLAQHSNLCNMDSFNLAVCTAQSLLFTGVPLTQKEEAQNTISLVQHMIDNAADIFGPDCLMLFESFPGPVEEDPVCHRREAELNRSISEPDYNPVTSGKASLQIQSSQSCDSGFQFGEEGRDSAAESSSDGTKYLIPCRSIEEEEEAKLVVSKKPRCYAEKLGSEIPLMHPSLSIDTLSSLQSADSFCARSIESPVNESIEISDSDFAELLTKESILTDSSTESPCLRGPNDQSMEICYKETKKSAFCFSDVSPSGRSLDPVRDCQNVKVDESVDSPVCKETSSMQFSKSMLLVECQSALRNQLQNRNKPTETTSEKSVDGRRRAPLLGLLHGTSFAEKCVETPEELKEEKLSWSDDGNVAILSAAAKYKQNPNDSGEFDSDELCTGQRIGHASASMKYSLSSGYSSQQSRTEDAPSEQKDDSSLSLSPRRQLMRTDAVEWDGEKLKLGMSLTGSDLFPLHTKNLNHQSSESSGGLLPSEKLSPNPSVSSQYVPAVCISMPERGIVRQLTGKWNKMESVSKERPKRSLPSYEEALLQKASNTQLVKATFEKRSGFSQQKSFVRGNSTNKKLVSLFKSLDDVSAIEQKSSSSFHRRTPSQGCIPTDCGHPRVATDALSGEGESSKLKDGDYSSVHLDLHAERRRHLLCDDEKKKNSRPQIFLQIHTTSCMRVLPMGSSVVKQRQSSGSSGGMDDEEQGAPEPSSRPRLTKKRVKTRGVRKRNSDPRMNGRKTVESRIRRSKSDSADHCQNNKLSQFQTNVARNADRTCSKENAMNFEEFVAAKVRQNQKSFNNQSLKDLNQAKRRSVTVKDKDWHKELAEQYTDPDTFSFDLSPSKKDQLSTQFHRFGREVKEADLTAAVATHSSKSSGCSSFGAAQGVSKVTLHLGESDNRIGNKSHATSLSSQNKDCSSRSEVRTIHRWPLHDGASSRKLESGFSVAKSDQQKEFQCIPILSDVSRISPRHKLDAGESFGASFSINKSGRPSGETMIKTIDDDAVLLDPANISWSVARLKTLYSHEQRSSASKSATSSRSKSEDSNSSRKISALPRLG